MNYLSLHSISKGMAPVMIAIMAASGSLIAAPAPKGPKDAKAAAGSAKSPAKEKEAKEGEEKKDAPKSIAEITENARTLPGLFPLYEDRKNGTAWLAIRERDLGREFIYFRHIVDGVTDVGAFRGGFRGSDVFSIRKHFDRIEFVKENTSFYFDKKSPLGRAAEANISPAIMASQKIVAQDSKRGIYLVEADVFLTEAFYPVKPAPPSGDSKRFSLGALSKEKTKFRELRNYPENTALTVEYVYDNPHPKSSPEDAVTDPRYVSIVLQHTLIRMPRNDYEPRFDDPRVGFFMKPVTDMTSTSATPYRDVIHRWKLKKKNPEAELSEPVEPITFWIENTTPLEFRDTIRESGLLWNEAFASAGFKKAVAIKVQPDDAKWDAGDIRYNVLRWTSSPDPPFGGYGPSFTNPRTGEILGADVMLEWTFVTNRLRQGWIYSGTGEAAAKQATAAGGCAECGRGCLSSMFLQSNNLLGKQALKARGSDPEEMERLVRESLHYLVLHEIGHTLGLMHNMKASQLHPIDQINNRALTEKEGLTASVMDYPAINFAPKGVKQGNFYTTRPGAYDHWAIEFGYFEAANKKEERTRRAKILARSTEHALKFGNDADDMRSPGSGIDPRVMIYDLSGDAVEFATERCVLIDELLDGLAGKYLEKGETHQPLADAFAILMKQYGDQGSVISRYPGGVYVDRSVVGQAKDKTAPYGAVPAALQKQAMASLKRHFFGPKAFSFNEDLLRRLQPQRRGFKFGESSGNEDPEVHAEVLGIQRRVLDHLLHRNTLQRVTDSALYGNGYPLGDYLLDLTGAIMGNDEPGANQWRINSFRRPLQSEYVERLIAMSGVEGSSGYHADAEALAFYLLKSLRTEYGVGGVKKFADTTTRAHVTRIAHRIERALDDD